LSFSEKSSLLLGPPGVGKTRLAMAMALGGEDIVRGYSTLFVPATNRGIAVVRAAASTGSSGSRALVHRLGERTLG
jgi:DNA replication protein DnaC